MKKHCVLRTCRCRLTNTHSERRIRPLELSTSLLRRKQIECRPIVARYRGSVVQALTCATMCLEYSEDSAAIEFEAWPGFAMELIRIDRSGYNTSQARSLSMQSENKNRHCRLMRDDRQPTRHHCFPNTLSSTERTLHNKRPCF
jgi:hypothetical protein